MTNFARIAALAAAAGLAFAAAPAAAAPVGVTGAAPKAQARIIRPLTLSAKRNLDFGTIVLGAVPAGGSTVSITAGGTFACGSGLACSGAPQTAQYNVTGTQGQTVVVTASNVSLTGSNGGSLTFVPSVPANFSLPNSGSPGFDFGVGGAITIVPTTVDGVYSGDLVVQVDYQ